jgi:hypothetical protein
VTRKVSFVGRAIAEFRDPVMLCMVLGVGFGTCGCLL